MIDRANVLVRYTVTAGVGSYAVPFPIYGQGDVRVTWSTDGRTENVLRAGSDYSVSLLRSGGGTVHLQKDLPVGATLAVASAIPATQEVDFSSTAEVDTQALETQLDRMVQTVQQLEAAQARSVQVPEASTQSPQELAAELFDAKDNAQSSAADAAASAAEAKGHAAQAAEIKAAALREVREEADAQAQRLDDLTDSHILTLEREVQRAHVEADRAESEADRARAEADRAGQIATLAQGAENFELTWITTESIAAGTSLELPWPYIVGRKSLRMSWGGVELYRGAQFVEVGDADSLSTRVIILCEIPAGAQLHAWAVASNVARNVEEAEQRADASAERAAASAQDAADAVIAAGRASDAAQEQAQEAARQAGISSNAAQESTEQADRAEGAATDAEKAARQAIAAACGKGIAVVQSLDVLADCPDGLYLIDPSLAVPATCALPLNFVPTLEDVVCDGFWLVGLETHCPDPCPPSGETGGVTGTNTLCGKRKKLLAA